MKSKYFLMAAATCCASALLSCNGKVLTGKGEKSLLNPTVQSFDAVDISVSAKASISVVPGSTASVKIEGYKNLLDHIKIKVEQNKLSIYSDVNGTWILDAHAGTVITITTPSLAALDISGDADADLHGSINGPAFALSLAGASKVIADSINATDFTTDVSGAANIVVNGGHAKHATYQLSGATKLYAFPLITSRTSTEISGAGRAEVTAYDSLDASISGAGTIHYKGHPNVTKDVSGAGSIKDAN